jgi:hypothetical protein
MKNHSFIRMHPGGHGGPHFPSQKSQHTRTNFSRFLDLPLVLTVVRKPKLKNEKRKVEKK